MIVTFLINIFSTRWLKIISWVGGGGGEVKENFDKKYLSQIKGI